MKFKVMLVALVVLSCTKEQKTIKSNLNYLPPNPTVVVKINQAEAFKSEVKNNTFLSKITKSQLFTSVRAKVEVLTLNKIGAQSLLGIYPLGKDNHEFVLLQTTDAVPLDISNSRSNKLIETLLYENHEVKSYLINNQSFYGTKIDGINLLSSSQLLLENCIRSRGRNQTSKTLEKLIETADTNKSASFFFDMNQNSVISSALKTNNNLQIASFADWMALDFSAKQDEFLFSGVAIASDSTRNFIHLFKGTTPLLERTTQIAPQNTEALLNFSFDDYQQFSRNQASFLDATASAVKVLDNIEGIGVIFLNGEKAIAVHTSESERFNELLNASKTTKSSYQESEIWRLQKSDFTTAYFNPLVKNFTSNFFTVFENTFVFATNESTLQTFIASSRSGYTFDKGAVFGAIKNKISNESTIQFISGRKGITYFLDKHFKSGLSQIFDEKSLQQLVFSTQLVSDGDFSHFNILVTNIKKSPVNNSVAPLYNLELDSDIVTRPQFVKNHRNNTYEIVVQDIDNNLYLISTEGKVLWKKQLEGKIRGKIHQVDLFKNGKLQLAFNTNNQFLVLDRNGEEVPPFNKKFEGGNLNGLAVFDYENSRNYRFVVTQGRKVFMYDTKGDIVEGFSYTETSSPVIAPPKHFKNGKKDYLSFQLENGELQLRHRAGGERIKVNRKIDFSNNEVFLYKNKFSVTDKKGILHQVDNKGKLSATNFNLGEDHGMFATSKTLTLMNDNVLSIKGKKVDLEFGVYTPPRIFYINDKIYVSVTDIQNQKVYLFDSQAKPIPNFPVYGTSMIDLLDMNNDGKLELVAKDQENSIIVYAIN